MGVDLAMIDHAVLAGMDKLDRVLDGDHVVFTPAIDFIDDRGKSRGLAASRWAGNQHQPAGKHGQAADHRRQTELRHRLNLVGNLAEDRPNPILLPEVIGTIAGQSGYFIAKIEISGFLEDLDLLLWGDFIEHGPQFVVIQHLVFHPFEVSPNAQDRLLPRNQVDIRGFLLVHQFEKRIDACHEGSSFVIVWPRIPNLTNACVFHQGAIDQPAAPSRGLRRTHGK